MNILRLFYMVPLCIFALGVLVGWTTIMATPFIRRYVIRNAEQISKRIETLRKEQAALNTVRSPLQAFLADDARKRAN